MAGDAEIDERARGPPAAVAAAALLLALAACGGGGEGSTGSSDSVKSLRVLDYYTNEPDKTVYTKVLDACGKANGVTIQREAVPGDTLIQKVLQQSSSKTLPDVLMLDNPDLQQIAATGALAPLDEFGLSADGYVEGCGRRLHLPGQALRPAADHQHDRALLQQGHPRPRPASSRPTTWDELRTAAKQLTSGKQYGIAFSAPANYEGTWQFLPFMWSNGGDEKNIATPQTAAALQLLVDLVKDGSASKSVLNWTQADVNDQFKAGNAAMMINGPWQFPVLNDGQVAALRRRAHPGAEGGRHRGRRRSAARRGPCRRPATRRARQKAAKIVAVPQLRREPVAAGQGAPDRAHQDGAAGASSWPTSRR